MRESGVSGARRFDLSDKDYIEAYEKNNFQLNAAAAELGVHSSSMWKRLVRMKRDGEYDFEARRGFTRDAGSGKYMEYKEPVAYERPALASADTPINELLKARVGEFQRRREAVKSRELIPVNIKNNGPVGIHLFGDPHLDDPGCDIERLMADVELIKSTEGMMAASIGDQQNLWIGRLARLYANQRTTAREAWKLVEWFVNELEGRWLFLIAGNHDLWAGNGDPVQWIASRVDAIYEAHKVRVALRFPNGREVRIAARHEWAGHSMWNPTHGQLKAAHMQVHDHVIVSGHRHTGGYQRFWVEPARLVTHCVQLGSYKVYDDYAEEKGMKSWHLSPSTTLIIDPDAEKEVSLVQVYENPEEAADVLTMKRDKFKGKRKR